MRQACDQKVQSMEETILLLTKRLEKGGDIQQDDLVMKLLRSENELKQLQDELSEVRQQNIVAQEEVQAKTVQVKQYQKKDNQREERVRDIIICV